LEGVTLFDATRCQPVDCKTLFSAREKEYSIVSLRA
jgi:hypothetical protein